MLESIGQYRILERVGATPLGETYRARDTRLGRTVAITIVADAIAADADRHDQFLTDARRLAALSHPNIAAIYEVGEEQGAMFLATEFVPGQPLGAMIASHPLNPRRAIDFATQMADALAEAHSAGISHGAIRADAVVITPKGNAKIPDFGFAQWTGASATPAEGDEGADLWALGVVLYQMLTGTVPRSGWPAPAPSTIHRSVPRELDPILARFLAIDQVDRYQSAVTVAAELRSVAAILDARAGASQPPVLARSKPARPRALWIAIAIVLVVIGALVWGAIR